jgi:hypothetical protein
MTHSYKELSANELEPFGKLQREKATLPNGWREHDSDRSLFEQEIRMHEAMTDPHENKR